MNEFDNLGDGYTSDGKIVFNDDKSFTLWGLTGKWEVLNPTSFKVTFGDDYETYEFQDYNPTIAVRKDWSIFSWMSSAVPMKIVMSDYVPPVSPDAQPKKKESLNKEPLDEKHIQEQPGKDKFQNEKERIKNALKEPNNLV